MKIRLFSLLLMLVATGVNAIKDQNMTIDRLGVQGAYGYFDTLEGFSTSCKWGIIYLNITSDFGKAAYSSILSAKVSGRKLSKIIYSQSGIGEKCTLTQVEIKD